MLLEHPHTPTCADCKKWLYKDGKRELARGLPIPRPKGAPLPCHKCPKSPDGRPNPGADMKGRHAGAYELYLLVKAGLPVPDDAITRQNCVLIQAAVDAAAARRSDWAPLLGLLLGGGTKR